MKKVLKIGGIILAVIILLMILIPIMFKGKIKDAVLGIANEQLNATVAIEDFGLSLFSNFPKATISLENVTVIGKDDFATDTLLQAKSASATIDLASLFGDNYKISKITLDRASVLAKVLADGRPNWDIVKDSGEEEVVADTEESSAFNLDLQKIEIKNCTIVYDDQEGKMKAILKEWNGTISGDFSASETTLKTSSKINEVTVMMSGVPYLNKIKVVADAQLKADLDNMKFEFIDSKLSLNELTAAIDGSFGFVGEEGMEFDLKLNAPDTKFKQVLSIVPAMYTKEFKDVKTDGSVSLDAYVKGVMEGETYPAFDVKLNVANAMFQYPSLPQAVNGINIAVGVTSKGGSLDNTVIDVSKFAFNMAGNPFNMTLHVTTPISDANVKAQANGKIDLGQIKNIYPLEKGTELNGKITADLNVAARMSLIEKEQFEQIQAKGVIELSEMIYKAEGAQDVVINKAGLEFTPRYVNLNSFDVKIGQNDIAAKGRLENFIAYAMKDKELRGQLYINSNYLNLNDFMGGDEEAAVDTTASEPLNELSIPKNLNLGLNVDFKKIVFAKIDITNVAGAMRVKDGILSLNNVGANLLQGTCKMTGALNTVTPKAPKANFAMELANVSFAETFKSVETIQKLAPIFENMQGTYGMYFDFKTTMGATTDETLNALDANGTLKTNNLKIENVPALTALSKALKTDALKTIAPKDVNISFVVKDGRVTTKPFTLNLGQGGTMKLEGSTGLDQTIDYLGTVTLPKGLSNDYVNNVPITIKGEFSSPKIGVDAKAMAGEALSGLAGKLFGKDKKEGEEGGSSVSEKIAEKTGESAQKMRTDAQAASDRLVKEAEKQAADMEEKAEGKLKKLAAKKAGEALVSQAKKSGQKLVDAANEKADKLEAGQEVKE